VVAGIWPTRSSWGTGPKPVPLSDRRNGEPEGACKAPICT
jgi:hypothetical protein